MPRLRVQSREGKSGFQDNVQFGQSTHIGGLGVPRPPCLALQSREAGGGGGDDGRSHFFA